MLTLSNPRGNKQTFNCSIVSFNLSEFVTVFASWAGRVGRLTGPRQLHRYFSLPPSLRDMVAVANGRVSLPRARPAAGAARAACVRS